MEKIFAEVEVLKKCQLELHSPGRVNLLLHRAYFVKILAKLIQISARGRSGPRRLCLCLDWGCKGRRDIQQSVSSMLEGPLLQSHQIDPTQELRILIQIVFHLQVLFQSFQRVS